MGDLVYKDYFIAITKRSNNFYLESFQPGMTAEKLNAIVQSLPMINITSFFAIKSVLQKAPHQPILFGEGKERIKVEVSSDQLKAYLMLNVQDTDLEPECRRDLIVEILTALGENNVFYGINSELLKGTLVNYQKILIAEGIPAINGKDAVIRQFQLDGPKPQVIDNDRVNYYEMNLIHHVNEGDWLGDRSDPTPGIEGKTVTGKIIKPVPGRMFPLLFDRISVREGYKDGVTTLYARKSGAVIYRGDRITVYDYLEVKGNVDFKTGNVDFDGFLSVKGTVEDSFSVAANKDIEIMGEYGVGAARKIESRDGNIYIKGGISGKNKASIYCTKNLYVKYLKDVEVECEGTVYVGFYIMNATIQAKQIIVESPKGKIVGGKVSAEVRIESAEIGNKAEPRTIVRVNGFDRGTMKAHMDKIIEQLDEAKKQMTKIKQIIQIYSGPQLLTNEQRTSYTKIMENFAVAKDLIRDLELERKNYTQYLRTPGEGAVVIKSRIYPKVRIEIKNDMEEIMKEKLGCTYYYSDREIRTLH